MKAEITPQSVSEVRQTWRNTQTSFTAGGLALTTTPMYIFIPPGTDRMHFIPRNFSTAVGVHLAFNPWLHVLKTTNLFASQGQLVDYSEAAQDLGAGETISLNALDTLVNGDALFIGAHLPFRGVDVDMTSSVNSETATLTVAYWTGSAWTTLSATDGTASGGAPFAVDGTVTWTVPANWTPHKLRDSQSIASGVVNESFDNKLFWTRWVVSAALSATVTVNSMLSMNRSVNYASYVASLEGYYFAVKRGPGNHGNVEARTDAGTANLIVNCLTNGSF